MVEWYGRGKKKGKRGGKDGTPKSWSTPHVRNPENTLALMP